MSADATRGTPVLLVEDDERNATLMRSVLQPAGFEIVHARNVAEARVALEGALPPLVLLDLRLPDEPGHVLAREIRARGDGADVHILAVSASVLEANRREALEAGCDGFVEKPISPRELLARIRAALGGTR
jgi:two-component system cell cycle response regulator DivK